MRNTLSCLLFLLLIPSYLLGNDLLTYLKEYEGRWVGHFTIHSTANGYTETFPVEQRYWWKDDILHGLLVTDSDGGIDTASSKTRAVEDKLISEVVRGETKETYYGILIEGALVWVPADMSRANDYQMKEWFIEKEGEPKKMKIEGFDTYVYVEGLAHLIYKGELTKQPTEQ